MMNFIWRASEWSQRLAVKPLPNRKATAQHSEAAKRVRTGPNHSMGKRLRKKPRRKRPDAGGESFGNDRLVVMEKEAASQHHTG